VENWKKLGIGFVEREREREREREGEGAREGGREMGFTWWWRR